MSIYIAHYRTVSLMRSMRRILLKHVRLQYRRPKLAMLSSGSRRSLLSSAFQTVGPTTAKAQIPLGPSRHNTKVRVVRLKLISQNVHCQSVYFSP